MTQKITAQLLKGGLTVNASGHITATRLHGTLTGNVTGDVTGNATTATTADSADTLNQQTSINLSGTYSTHQLLVADAYALTGNVTVNDNLILGKLSDDGNDFVIEGNYTFTTTGAGKVEAGYISSAGLSNVDGMTGTLGSGVTGGSGLTALGTISSGTLGSGVTFPTGHIIQAVTRVPSAATYSSTNWESTDQYVNITTTRLNSKMLVMWSNGGMYKNSGNSYTTLYRDSTNLGHASWGYVYGYSQMIQSLSIIELDSPAKAVGTIINYRIWTKQVSGTIWFNNGSGARSTITVLEIAP
tara:strand:- start:429 stop:1328 length:900 start_codon:yes stop_codon:yes gene_type:complete